MNPKVGSLAGQGEPEATILEKVATPESVVDIVATQDVFHIDSPRKANWLVRKLLEHRRYREQVKAWAENEVQRSERQEKHLLQRFGGQLESWIRGELDQRGARRRSISLPAGTVGLRTAPASLVVNDQEALVEWCRSHLSDALRIRIEAVGSSAIEMEEWATSHCADARQCVAIAKAVVNTYFAETGELPPGTEMIARQDVLTVK